MNITRVPLHHPNTKMLQKIVWKWL